jgi:hypothetical protein
LLRRDGDEFVVSSWPDDVIIFRNRDAWWRTVPFWLYVKSAAVFASAKPTCLQSAALGDPVQLGEWHRCHSDEYLPSVLGKTVHDA